MAGNLSAEDAAGLALSKVLFELLPQARVEGGPPLPTFEEFVAGLNWNTALAEFAHSLEVPKGTDGDTQEAHKLVDSGGTATKDGLDPEWVFLLLGVLEAVKHDSFRPWLVDFQKRLRWCRFSTSGTEQKAIEESAEQIALAEEAVRRALKLSEGQTIGPDAQPTVVSLAVGAGDGALAHMKSKGWLHSMESLDLDGTQVTDAGLAHLAGLQAMESLILNGTQVTDVGLGHLAGLKALQRLDLGDTQVTDAGLAHLAGLKGLQVLDLHGTQVTDAGLAHLAGLKGLQTLFRYGTQVTDAGVAAFQMEREKLELPKCRVLH